MKKPNIYEIKKMTKQTAPYYFDYKTMKFFGQTLKDFTVSSIDKTGRYKISAPAYDRGKYMGDSNRYFNPKNNKLELQ